MRYTSISLPPISLQQLPLPPSGSSNDIVFSMKAQEKSHLLFLLVKSQSVPSFIQLAAAFSSLTVSLIALRLLTCTVQTSVMS